MVARLKAAGGIVLAKTNTPEFGAGANTRNVVYGATGNPFDPTLLGRRLLRRVGGGAGHRHGAAGLGVGHGRFLAQPGGVLRRGGLPPLARCGAERVARPWVVAPVHAWADGAQRLGSGAVPVGDGGRRCRRSACLHPAGGEGARGAGRGAATGGSGGAASCRHGGFRHRARGGAHPPRLSRPGCGAAPAVRRGGGGQPRLPRHG